MRKYTAALFLGAIITVVLYGNVFAADVLYRMLHADEVKSFQKDQDAFIVGQLGEKHDNYFNVKVLKVISGRVTSDNIRVHADFSFGWGQNGMVPAVNDFCVMSLKKDGFLYKKAWGIFKSDNGNYKSLKLLPANAPSPGLLGDLACIEWFVNSGGRENDFSFNNTKAFVKRPNGQILQIYPKAYTVENSVSISSQQPEQKVNKGRRAGVFEVLMKSLGPILIAINLFGFILMGYDKQKAKNKSWRIPELNMFLIALLGGATGILLGMRVFRHKTQHYYFVTGILLLIILNLISFNLILRKL